jgi:hypothetical protein
MGKGNGCYLQVGHGVSYAVAFPKHVFEAGIGQDRYRLALTFDHPADVATIIGFPNPQSPTLSFENHWGAPSRVKTYHFDATMMTRECSANFTAGSSGRTKPFSTIPATATGRRSRDK